MISTLCLLSSETVNYLQWLLINIHVLKTDNILVAIRNTMSIGRAAHILVAIHGGRSRDSSEPASQHDGTTLL